MSTSTSRTEPQGGAKLLIDLGPLLIFFLVNFLAPVPQVARIFVATGAFMVAMLAAMLFSAFFENPFVSRVNRRMDIRIVRF